MALNLKDMQKICVPENIILTMHAAKRIEQRGILLRDIIACIMTGEIIEQYADDYPYPSCLVLGNHCSDKPLHTVVGTDGNYLWIITAYYPSSQKWLEDLKTRKEN